MTRRGRRGSTLIELMVSVAIIGIAFAGAGAWVEASSAPSLDALHRERALQVLEHEARARIGGGAAEAAATRALLEELPQGELAVTRRGDRTELTVSWRGARGPVTSRTLAIVERPR